MADKKITQFPNLPSRPRLTDIVWVVRGGLDYKFAGLMCIPDATENNLVSINAQGQLVDSGVSANAATVIKESDDIISAYDVVYLTADDKVKRASASDYSTAVVFGIALQSGVVGANIRVQVGLSISYSSWAWDVNKSIWLDTALGGLTQTRPTASGTQLCYLGMPTSSTSFILNPIGSRYLGQN